MPGAKPPQTARLQRSDGSADYQCGEDSPREVGLRLPACPENDAYANHRGGQCEHHALKADADGNERWAPLVGLIADIFVDGSSCHATSEAQRPLCRILAPSRFHGNPNPCFKGDAPLPIGQQEIQITC